MENSEFTFIKCVCVLCSVMSDSMDCSLPGSFVHGIFHPRIPEWVVISYSRGSSWPRDRICISCIGRLILYHSATWEALIKYIRNIKYLELYYLAAAAAKSLQSCLTLCDHIDGSPPGSPSLGFSRQEHRSGLPFPSPMPESEWKQSCSVMSDS